MRVVPGAADYYNLTVSDLHTFAVGAGRYVVHNCGGADPEGAFSDLAQRRQALKMGEPMSKKGGTLSRLDVGDQSFYGRNAHRTDIDLTVNNISKTHAEAESLQLAKNAGVKAREGYLYVDRPLCKPCGQFGAVKSMARQIGLDTLHVYHLHPGGGWRYFRMDL